MLNLTHVRNFVQPAAFLLPLLVSCSGAEPPEDPVHTYTLTAIDGRSLPQLLTATTSCDETLLRGTLVLTSEGTHSLALDTMVDCSRVGGVITPAARAFAGAYEFHNGIITFHDDSRATSSNVWTGTLHGATLRVVLPPLTQLSIALLNATFRAT
jgi:hypothetical protein